MGFADDVGDMIIGEYLGAALLLYANQHATTTADVLSRIASAPADGLHDVVLRDSPVMSLSPPPAGSPPDTVQLALRGSLPIFPKFNAYVHLTALLTISDGDLVWSPGLTSLTLEVSFEKEGVFNSRLGGHFDAASSDVVLSGDLLLISLGANFDVTVGWSATGFLVQGDLVLPVAIPLAFTAGVISAAGLFVMVAENFAPNLNVDNDAGTLADPTAMDYAKWATGPFLQHPEDAWTAVDNVSACGLGFALEDFPTRGNLAGANPVGMVLVFGPTGPVIIAGGHGFMLKSPKFSVDAFICARPLIPDFAFAGQVEIEVPGASDSDTAHGTPATPSTGAHGGVAPGTTDPPPVVGGGADAPDSIFKGEGKVNLYLGPAGWHLEIGSPHDPVTLEFLKQLGPHGLCQIQFFLVIDQQTGVSYGFTGVAGFEFGDDDSWYQFGAHLSLEVFGIYSNSPPAFEGRWAIAFDFRIRVMFVKLGIAATAMIVAFSEPKKAVADVALDIELPFPLPSIDIHTTIEVVNDPVPPEFNPPMLVGAYEVGADG